MKIVARLAAALTVLLLALPAFADDEPGLRMTFVGEVVDPDGNPVSGVFPLTLRLFESADAGDAIWVDTRFVAVSEGRYVVGLGSAEPLPASLRGRSLFLGVTLAGSEIARVPLTIEPDPPRRTRDEIVAEIDLTWADLSERAVLAHDAMHADDCDMVGGRTLAELDRYDELLAEIVRVRDAIAEARGARLSSQTVTLERIGGAGGNPYARTCPPGHVVVGVRGGSGALIDSIELVCAPLQ